MERKKKIDNLFNSALGDYTETPPPPVWDALEERLDGAPKPGSPFIRLGYIGLACLLIGASIWLAVRPDSSKEQLVQNTDGSEYNTAPSSPIRNNGNNAPDTDHEGNVLAANKTDNNSNTSPNTNTPTTGPNRISNIKPEVYNASGAPVNAAIKNAVTAKGKQVAEVTGTNNSYNKKAKSSGNKEHNASSVTNGKNKNGPNNSSRNKPYKTNLSAHGTYALGDVELSHSGSEDNENSHAPSGSNTSASSTKQDDTKNDTDQADNNTDKDNDEGEDENNHQQQPGKNDIKNPPMPNDVPKPKKPKARFDRFEAGVKAGYELGFNSDAAQKGVLASFMQYRFSKKVGIMLQPAVKYSNVTGRQIGDATSYYKTNSDNISVNSVDEIAIGTVDSLGNPIPGYRYNYVYRQSHDSIVKSRWTGGKYLEVEIPLLAKYYVSKKFSVYGGVNVAYSKLTGLTERTYTEQGLIRAVGLQSGILAAPIQPSELSRPDFKYTGTPYAQYTGPQYPAPTASAFRIGYMAGFSWEFEDRWLIDALVQQTFIKPNVQAGFNTYTPLATPYIRLSLGYKIIK